MRIAINGNRHQEGHLENIDRLVSALVRRGDTVAISDRFLRYLEARIGGRFAIGIESIPITERPNADLALSIGGDGAFLKTAAWVADGGTPVAGINTGHLGFLAAFSFDRPQEIEEVLLGHTYQVEHRSVMQIEVEQPQGCPRTLFALNEGAITRADNASMVSLRVSLNGAEPLDYLGDGLIVATPTGSTAYNLSVGGPILEPHLPGWVISPIAAHSLSVRPLVISDTGVVDIHVHSRANTFRLTVDGRAFALPVEQHLRITRAPYRTAIAYAPGHTFTQALRTKLGFNN